MTGGGGHFPTIVSHSAHARNVPSVKHIFRHRPKLPHTRKSFEKATLRLFGELEVGQFGPCAPSRTCSWIQFCDSSFLPLPNAVAWGCLFTRRKMAKSDAFVKAPNISEGQADPASWFFLLALPRLRLHSPKAPQGPLKIAESPFVMC